MATRTASRLERNDGKFTAQWEGLLNTDVGSALGLPSLDIVSIQVVGTLGTGGQITMQGSNDGGTTWGTLHGPGGVAAVLTAIGQWVAIIECPLLIRPLCAGDGTTDLDIYLVASVRRA